MRGLPSILSLLRNMFNKFNNTGLRMLFYLTYDIKMILKDAFILFPKQCFLNT